MKSIIAIATDVPGVSVAPPQQKDRLNRKTAFKLRRTRVELRVYFRIRSGQVDRPGKKQLYIRLSVDGEKAGDYGSGIYVRPNMWKQSDQQCTGRSQEAADINERLGEVELAHRQVLREMKTRYAKGEGPRPSAERIKGEYLKPGTYDPDLLVFYARYYGYQDSLAGTEDGKAKKTMDRLQTSQKYLAEFIPYFCLKDDLRGRLTLRSLTAAFGKQYHAWLQVNPDTGNRRMQKDSANKYLSELRKCLEYAIDSDLLSKNPLDRFRPKRGKGKDVFFLEPTHLERLMGLGLSGSLSVTIWWAKLMCLTGLDYCDAVLYAQNRTVYHQQSQSGKNKIVIKRSKPPCNYCEIYLLPEVETLFVEYPNGPLSPSLGDLNRNLLVIQEVIDFPFRLSSKICRKTAGAHFLRLGFQMSTVSKMLGHSSVRTTEQYYVRVTASHVDRDIDRVLGNGELTPLRPIINNQPFVRVA